MPPVPSPASPAPPPNQPLSNCSAPLCPLLLTPLPSLIPATLPYPATLPPTLPPAPHPAANQVSEELTLNHNDRLIMGNSQAFRFVDPVTAAKEEGSGKPKQLIDWDLAQGELNEAMGLAVTLKVDEEVAKKKAELDAQLKVTPSPATLALPPCPPEFAAAAATAMGNVIPSCLVCSRPCVHSLAPMRSFARPLLFLLSPIRAFTLSDRPWWRSLLARTRR